MTELTKLTTDELVELENNIFDQWEKTERVHSLGEYSEIVRELTLREVAPKPPSCRPCTVCRKHPVKYRDYRFIESCGLQGKGFVCMWCKGLDDVAVAEIFRDELDPRDFYDEVVADKYETLIKLENETNTKEKETNHEH